MAIEQDGFTYEVKVEGGKNEIVKRIPESKVELTEMDDLVTVANRRLASLDEQIAQLTAERVVWAKKKLDAQSIIDAFNKSVIR